MIRVRSFFPSGRAGWLAGLAVAGVLASSGAWAQETPAAGQSAPAAGTQSAPVVDGTLSNTPAPATPAGKKDGKVVQSKDTRRLYKKDKKIDTMAGADAKLPDKALYDKAQVAMGKGHFDVARLDLQTMLNTYPDSQYQMRAKLAIADSWYKEGGTAALTQAESEYADFVVFYPNVPEAAEAQMRIGDIYFKQMDKPDRDYAKATHAEEEYRRMLTDYPDSTLVPQAKQRLRDVQEVMATRESDVAAYYGTRENWAAAIARYQTVVDRYPLFSHMDDTLIGLGDAYEAEARYIRGQKLAEGPKAQLERTYDERAAAMYRRVVLDHAASPHVEDARDRLAAMNQPIPAPTLDQVQASQAMENSRNSYKLTDRVGLMLMHHPDTVTAARLGEPTLTDPKPTLAPQVIAMIKGDFEKAFNPGSVASAPVKPALAVTDAGAPVSTPPVTASPLQFNEVAPAGGSDGVTTMTSTPSAGAGVSAGTGLGIEVISPTRSGTADPNNGLKAVGPENATPLAPVEKAAAAPSTVNEISAPQAPAQAPRADGKKTKPEFDKADESSSKHKKKKGLKKLNPL